MEKWYDLINCVLLSSALTCLVYAFSTWTVGYNNWFQDRPAAGIILLMIILTVLCKVAMSSDPDIESNS